MIDGIVCAIRDKSQMVRLNAIDILRECLIMTSKRSMRDQTPQQSRIRSHAIQGLTKQFNRNEERIIHGSLLTIGIHVFFLLTAIRSVGFQSPIILC